MKLLISLLAFISLNAYAEPKYLTYQMNDSVRIVISNVACPFEQIKDDYAFAVAAFRADGEKLAGCYKRHDENLIEIQWRGGDKTIIPANAFLQISDIPTVVPTL